MNIHEIPAFTQNFSIIFTCVSEAVIMLFVMITKPESKKSREKLFLKNRISLFFFIFYFLNFCCCSSSSSGCHGVAVIGNSYGAF